MADISNLSNYLKDIANAIREKKGTEEQIPAENFDTEILSITSGGAMSLEDYELATSIADLILANDYTGEIVSTNLGAYYKGGTLTDLSGNNRSGTLTGEYISREDRISFVGGYGTTGNIGKSVGSWEIFLNIPSTFVPVNTRHWYELSCIVGAELPQAQQDFGIVIDKYGHICVGYDFDTLAGSIVKINDGKDHHIVLNVFSNQLDLYVDNTKILSVTHVLSGTIPSAFGICWNKSSSKTSVAADVYMFRNYSTPLTEKEINNNYLCCINNIF